MISIFRSQKSKSGYCLKSWNYVWSADRFDVFSFNTGRIDSYFGGLFDKLCDLDENGVPIKVFLGSYYQEQEDLVNKEIKELIKKDILKDLKGYKKLYLCNTIGKKLG